MHSEPFERFSLNLNSNVPLSDLMCRTNGLSVQHQSQGLTLRSWNSAVGDMAVLQTAVLFVYTLLLEYAVILCFGNRFS